VGELGLKGYLVREVILLRTLSHPNIIRLEQLEAQEHSLLLHFKYYPMTLRQLSMKGPLPAPRVKLVMRQILQAVKYMHSMNTTHRDLKP
jgi:serine/threonine protein kinase